jgi:hypothetical protein
MIMVAALDDLGGGRLACVDPNPNVKPEHWQAIAHRAKMFVALSPAVLPEVVRALGGKLQFALIDGDHTTEGVIRDIDGILPYLEDDAHLLLHDAHFHEVAEGIRVAVERQGNNLVDCGLISTEKTDDPKNKVVWGGLRLLRFQRT